MMYIRQLWIISLVLFCLPLFQLCTAFIQRLTKLEPQCPEKCSCSRYLTVVSCVGLLLRSVPADIPLSVTELDLNQNLLTEIGHGAFKNLTCLKVLRLGSNSIENIADNAFLGLNRLGLLILSSNKLTSLLPEAFRGLDSLRRLYLTDNQLTRIPDMRYTPSLTVFALKNNSLESGHVPDGFKKLTRLSVFNLAGNAKLTRIDDGDFAALNRSTIRKIDVSHCGLNHIGKDVFNFPNLQSLVLAKNTMMNETFLRSVLSLLANCLELHSLDLSDVLSLESLPADIFSSLASVPLTFLNLAHTTRAGVIHNKTFQYLPTLKYLDLSHSEFRIIHDDMSEMKNLKSLRLFNNKRLQFIPTLNLHALTILDISGCTGLWKLKSSIFCRLPSLSALNMRGCRIRKIHDEGFLGLNQLQKLDLSYNLLGRRSSLRKTVFDPLTSLTKLDLRGNRLKQIPRKICLFHGLKNLNVLDLSENWCYMIHEDIFNPLSKLTSLDLSGNSLGGSVINATRGGKLFHGLGTLERVNLMGNNINELPRGLFDNLVSLRIVNLSHNQLSGWNGSAFSASMKISVLDFSANKITAIPQSSIVPLAPQVKLKLGANPFSCWCDLIWFRNWIKDNSITDRKLPGLTSYRCRSPNSMRNKALLDFDPRSIAKQCSPPPWIIITASVGSGVAVVIVIIVVLCYKYRWPIRLKVYRIRKHMRGEPAYTRLGEATEDDYDVYVSYGPSTADEDWVARTLMTVIDVRERERCERPSQDGIDVGAAAAGEAHETLAAFRAVAAYWEQRDMELGASEIGAIAEAINGSRKILLIVSAEYLNDGRRDFEMCLAVDKSCRARRQLADIAVVLLDHAAAVNLPPTLHSKLEEALEWTPYDANGQQLFWQKLGDFLHSDVPLHVF